MPSIMLIHNGTRSLLLLTLLALLLCLDASPAAAFFGGHQGSTGGRGGGQGSQRNEVDYYKALELEQAEEATEKDIKQSFRRLSRLHHPDVAGTEADRRRYAEINRAYEVLSDKRKRKMYDMRGETGVEQLETYLKGGDNAGRSRHPFEQLFGIGGGGVGSLKGPNTEGVTEVSLSFLFSGGNAPFEIEKQQVCRHCKGTGAERNSPLGQCHHCRGHGEVRQRLQMGPGMYQEIRQMCPHCQGTGKTAKYTCNVCHGGRVVRKKMTLLAELEPGTPAGHKIVFDMEAEESPDQIPGDLILTVQEAPHPVFKRRRNAVDLEATMHVSLKEALLGFEMSMTHLDGVEQVLVRRSGVVTPYGTVLKIVGKGMPRFHKPSERGDLYLTVKFSLPNVISEEQRKAIMDGLF